MAPIIAWTAIGCADRTARLDPIDPFVLEPMPLAAKLIVSRESLVRQLEAAGTLIYVGEAFAQYADAYIDRGFWHDLLASSAARNRVVAFGRP